MQPDAPLLGIRRRSSAHRALLAWLAVAIVALGACSGGQLVSPPGERLRGDPDLGLAAITDYGCAACHTIPGVPGARATVGPPLTRWAERRTIAGHLANTPANLVSWIMEPQAIDPGNVMPDLGVTREDATHIAAYLYTLR